MSTTLSELLGIVNEAMADGSPIDNAGCHVHPL